MPPARLRDGAILTDSNVIIEAVRIGAWNAVSGQLRLETVQECWDETQRVPQKKLSSYVPVTVADVGRLRNVCTVTRADLTAFQFAYDEALGLDPGERHLLAEAKRRIDAGDDVWFVGSPDRAAVRAAVRLGWADHITSLGAMVAEVGVQPVRAMADHFTQRWLSDFRTACLLNR